MALTNKKCLISNDSGIPSIQVKVLVHDSFNKGGGGARNGGGGGGAGIAQWLECQTCD